MNNTLRAGHIVEFLGCSLTQLNPCKEVKILEVFEDTQHAYVEFPKGSTYKYREGSAVKGPLAQVVKTTSLIKRHAPAQDNTRMSLKITTSYKVQGQETKELSAECQADMISKQQQSIESLEKVKPKTKRITALLAELKQDLATFVEHMDSMST